MSVFGSAEHVQLGYHLRGLIVLSAEKRARVALGEAVRVASLASDASSFHPKRIAVVVVVF